MTAGAPFIVSLDGPSDTGKSTLALGLRDALEEPTVVLPCYVDFARAVEVSLPPDRAADVAGQLASLMTYLDLDRARRGLIGDPGRCAVAIADRSWLGLLGHVYAVERTGGPPAYAEGSGVARARAAELLQPALTLFMQLGPEQRRARADSSDVGAWNTNDEFNEELNRFFVDEARSIGAGDLVTLDASQSADEVLAQATQIIDEQRSGASQ